MGTTYKGLYLPGFSELNWDDELNENFMFIADKLVGTSIYLTAAQGTSSAGTQAVNVANAFPVAVDGFALPNGSTTGVYWTVVIPSNVDGTSPLLVRPIWFPTTTDATAHSVRWSMNWSGIALPAAQGLITYPGDTVAWTGASATRTAQMTLMESGGSTGALTVLPNHWFRFSLSRLGADALDTLGADIRLVGVQIDYTAG